MSPRLRPCTACALWPVPRRTYRIEDAPLMLALGACAGQMSVLTMALYWSDPITHIRFFNRVVGWLLCPLLLFWLCRLWFKAH